MIYALRFRSKPEVFQVRIRRFQAISLPAGQEAKYSRIQGPLSRQQNPVTCLKLPECRMNQDYWSNHCGICDAAISSDLSVCSECEKAFEPAPGAQPAHETTPLDLEQYSCRMFPWEQSANQLRLIGTNRGWLILALGLVVLVVFLALLRTPLPSCWELAS